MDKVAKTPKGFRRLPDGWLTYEPEREKTRTTYVDPGVAIKVAKFEKGVRTFIPGCSERVFGTFQSYPCGATPKHDPDANGRLTKCGRHCAAAKQRKQDKQDAATALRRAKWDLFDAINSAERKVEPALRQIAAGHNDPRSLAQEVIAALDAARQRRRDSDD